MEEKLTPYTEQKNMHIRMFSSTYDSLEVFKTLDNKILFFGTAKHIIVEEGNVKKISDQKDKLEETLELLGIYDNLSHFRAATVDLLFNSSENIFQPHSRSYSTATSQMYTSYKDAFKGMFVYGKNIIPESKDLFFSLGNNISSPEHLKGLETELLGFSCFSKGRKKDSVANGNDFFFPYKEKNDDKTGVLEINHIIEKSKYSKKQREEAEKIISFMDKYVDIPAPDCFHDESFMNDAVELLSANKDHKLPTASTAFVLSLSSLFNDNGWDWKKDKIQNHEISNEIFEKLFATNDLFFLRSCIDRNSEDALALSKFLMQTFPRQMFAVTQIPENKETLRSLIIENGNDENKFAKHIAETFIYGYSKTVAIDAGVLESTERTMGADALLYREKTDLKQYIQEQQSDVLDYFQKLPVNAWYTNTHTGLPHKTERVVNIEKAKLDSTDHYDISPYFEKPEFRPSVRELSRLEKEDPIELKKKILENPIFDMDSKEYEEALDRNVIRQKICVALEDVALKYTAQGNTRSNSRSKNQTAIADTLISLHETFDKYMVNMPNYENIIDLWTARVPAFKDYHDAQKQDNLPRQKIMSEISSVITDGRGVDYAMREAVLNSNKADGSKPYISEAAKANASKKYVAPKMKG